LAEEVKRRFLIPLWNVYSFFVTYARLDEWTPKNTTDQYSLLDRWILSKLQELVKDVTSCLQEYDIYSATARFEQYVDELSRWYVRRSRRRFWKSQADVDKNAGYTTLYTCLTTIATLLAPFLPFLTEEMYQNLVRRVKPQASESVHHNDLPNVDKLLIDEKLMANMDLTIKICSLGRSARNKAGIKLRQPLQEARVVAEKAMLKRLQEFTELIKDELNVKELTLTTQRKELLNYEVLPRPHLLGKKFGKLLPRLRETVAAMDTESVMQSLEQNQKVEIEVDDRVITLLPEEVEIRTQPKTGYALAEEPEVIVGVNTVVSEELKIEGLARDIVRRIQNQRKDAGFDIADQIETYYEAGPKLTQVFRAYEDYIAAETLSVSMRKKKPPKDAYVADYTIDDDPLKIGLINVSRLKP